MRPPSLSVMRLGNKTSLRAMGGLGMRLPSLRAMGGLGIRLPAVGGLGMRLLIGDRAMRLHYSILGYILAHLENNKQMSLSVRVCVCSMQRNVLLQSNIVRLSISGFRWMCRSATADNNKRMVTVVRQTLLPTKLLRSLDKGAVKANYVLTVPVGRTSIILLDRAEAHSP